MKNYIKGIIGTCMNFTWKDNKDENREVCRWFSQSEKRIRLEFRKFWEMAYPQVEDRGLQLWRVAAKTFNQPTRGCPLASRLGTGLTTTHHRNIVVTKCLKELWTWRNSLEKLPKLKNVHENWNLEHMNSIQALHEQCATFQRGSCQIPGQKTHLAPPYLH